MIKLLMVLLLLKWNIPVTEAALSQSIYNRYKNRKNADIYAKRIIIESGRRGLDPIAMTAVGWTESLFQGWRIRRSRGRVESVGVWQLVPYGVASRLAEMRLRGCSPPARLRGWYRVQWGKLARGSICEAQGVAAGRRQVGPFSISELQNPIISTYIAALGMKKHFENAKNLGISPRLINGCKLNRKLQLDLYRYGHYNSGNKRPRPYYLYRLCERYGILLEELGNHTRTYR